MRRRPEHVFYCHRHSATFVIIRREGRSREPIIVIVEAGGWLVADTDLVQEVLQNLQHADPFRAVARPCGVGRAGCKARDRPREGAKAPTLRHLNLGFTAA